jgi:prepilin-type N-terminal cleavage/methylation domain-containing protein
MRTCTAGSRRADGAAALHRGFTLLELLVTLVVIGLVSALAAPAIASRLLDPPAARSARLLRSLVDQAHGRAAAIGRPVAVVWLPGSRRFTLADAGAGAPRGGPAPSSGARGQPLPMRTAGLGAERALDIPAELPVDVRDFAAVRGGPWRDPAARATVLFPLGGSTGGSVRIGAGPDAVWLRIDPLTGNADYARTP